MPTIDELLDQGFRAFRRPHWGPKEWIHVASAQERADNTTEVRFCAHIAGRDPHGDANVQQWDDWQGVPWEHTAVEIGKLPDMLRSVAAKIAVGGVLGQIEQAIREDRVEATLAEFREKLGMPEEVIASLRKIAAERKVEMEQKKADRDRLSNVQPFTVGREMRA